MAGENDLSTEDLTANATDGDGLIEVFDQFSGLTSFMLDCLELDTTVVISETSLREKHYLPDHNSKPNNNITARHRGKYISCYGKISQVITSNASSIKTTHT